MEYKPKVVIQFEMEEIFFWNCFKRALESESKRMSFPTEQKRGNTLQEPWIVQILKEPVIDVGRLKEK